MIEFLRKLRDKLPRRKAHEQPGGLGLEFDIARGIVRQVRARPFIVQRPDSARCIPSQPRRKEE